MRRRGRGCNRKLDNLIADLFDPTNSKPLKGNKQQRSARVGGLRILFRVSGIDVVIVAIGPRGEIYKRL